MRVVAVLRGDPGHATGLESRGLELEVLTGVGRFDEAAALAAQLLRLHPGSPRIHYLAGQLAYRQRRYGEAIEHLRESSRLHPHDRSDRLLAKALTQAGELDEAERLLMRLVETEPRARRDLAWLYERRGDSVRAMRTVETYLAQVPDDELAKSQRLRLGARQLAPDAVVGEVEGLRELGEEVPESMIGPFAEALISLGRAGELRSFVAANESNLSTRARTSLGWTTYKLQLYDLAYRLFLSVLADEHGNFKLLTALELAADRCARLEELARSLEELAEAHPPLWGWARRARVRAGG